MAWAAASSNDVAEKGELARVAEATLLARANPDMSVIIDNFVELDRGYCSCQGLVDRLYNPKDGSRVMTSLDKLLPKNLTNPSNYQTSQHRIIMCDSDSGHVLLIVENGTSSEQDTSLPESLSNQQGTLTDLISGEEISTSYSALSERIAGGHTVQSPLLLILNNN